MKILKLKGRMILDRFSHRYHEDHRNKRRDNRGFVSFMHTDGPHHEDKAAQYFDVQEVSGHRYAVYCSLFRMQRLVQLLLFAFRQG